LGCRSRCTAALVRARGPAAFAEATLQALADRSHLRNMGCAARSFARTRTGPGMIDGLLQGYAEFAGESAHAARSGVYS